MAGREPTRRMVLGGLSGLAMAGRVKAMEGKMGWPVLELRQYKIVKGRRDALITLFEREFVEPQEALGMRLFGQFRDLDDASRFTWLRGFTDMPARAKALTDFYTGPVWQAHRGAANPLLEDNDNVLLLAAAWDGAGLPPPREPRAPAGSEPAVAGLVMAHILYLWRPPGEGFTDWFRAELMPAFAAAGMAVVGAYVPEAAPNNFPRLPVRGEDKLFVCFSRVADEGAGRRALAALVASPAWAAAADWLERAPQVLRLAPTARSALR
ncbi:NIPSNAP family protein [Niveispirillum sp. KHB5.9]|uniref:NIPSNAP family protein n=1 Tax=Niveispirillum sp. KHB5.9 TaxID=3400269 RepID=UPI003A8A8DAB